MTQEERKAERKEERATDRELERRRWIYPLIAVFISMFTAVGVNIVYTNMAIRTNEQTWCEMVGDLDKQNLTSPPPADNARAVTFARQIHDIAVKFKCT